MTPSVSDQLYLAIFLPNWLDNYMTSFIHLTVLLLSTSKRDLFPDLATNSGEILPEVLWVDKSFSKLFLHEALPFQEVFLDRSGNQVHAAFISSGSRP